MKKKLLYILIMTCFVNCKNTIRETVNNQDAITGTNSLIQDSSEDSSKYNIDFYSIKQNCNKQSTSSVNSGYQSSCLSGSDVKGFYGGYNLIDNITIEHIGYLEVFYPGKASDWRYDNKKEFFAELTLYGGRFIFFDSIMIGIHRDVLEKKISPYSHHVNRDTIFVDIGDYSSKFLLSGDTISRINIRQICKN